MAAITLGGKPCRTNGELPELGVPAPDFELLSTDLSDIKLSDFEGEALLLNIFPSIETGICATAARRFNEEAENLLNAKVLTISKDLPFALHKFRAAAGLENVVMTSAFRSTFGKDYHCEILDGAWATLLSRCVIVLDAHHNVVYTEQVSEIGEEPNYDAAIEAISQQD